MSKIYGSPLWLSGGGGMNDTLPPLLDNFKATRNEGNITLSASKMEESRAKELAGAVWVYGDHIPKNVNDGTKIQLTRDEIVNPDSEPYLTLNDIPASDAKTETIVNLKESDGKLHPYLYLVKDYEGSKAGLLLRKDISQLGNIDNLSGNKYQGNSLDTWCTNTFINNLDQTVQNALVAVDIASTSGTKINRKCFAISDSEYGGNHLIEGNNIPYFDSNSKRIAMYNNNAYDHWTRSSFPSAGSTAYFIQETGEISSHISTQKGYRPAICLTLLFKIKATPNIDGSYDMYEEQNSYKLTSYDTSVSDTVDSDGCYNITRISGKVEKQVSWEKTKNFHVRQFTYNSKKQYQTMIEGAVSSIIVEGAPANVTDFRITGSGANPVLSWVNPIDDELYQETVVIQKQDSKPTDITDGTEIYRGTDETCTATGLEQSTDYYFAVYTVSGIGSYKQPVISEVYRYDFPEEPTEYTMIEDKTITGEFIAPEDGWFRIDAIAKSGDGRRELRFTGRPIYEAAWYSSGGGGTGGYSRSEVALFKGDKLSIQITDSDINITGNSILINVTSGKDGNPASQDKIGTGGAAGTASGGNKINQNGLKGSDGNRVFQPGIGGKVYGGKGANQGEIQINNQKSYAIFGGNSASATKFTSSGMTEVAETSGNIAKVFISRGNTNIPSPSKASTLSLIPKNNSVEATWENSGDPVQTGTMLVYNTSHTPKSPSDGVVIDVPLPQPVTLALNSNREELQEDSKKTVLHYHRRSKR